MKPTPTTIEQFTVTCTRDLVTRLVDTFHKGSQEEKNEVKSAFMRLTTEMFNNGVKHDEQCRQLLQLALDGLKFSAWPLTDTSSGHSAAATGAKVR